ncbi:hypothetical protein NL676_009072 [Syzygium grande]|nr:hypothetical protein NL676_009072 [Syzygium grande]
MTSSVAQALPTLLLSILMKSYITIHERSVTAMIRRTPSVITINTAASCASSQTTGSYPHCQPQPQPQSLAI